MMRRAQGRLLVVLGAALLIAGLVGGCYYQQDYDDSAGPEGQGVQGPRLTVTSQPRWVPATGSSSATIMARLVNLEDGSGIPNHDILLRFDAADVPFAWFDDHTNTITVTTDGSGTAYATLHVASLPPSAAGSDVEVTVDAYTVVRIFDFWDELTNWTTITIYDPNIDT